MESDNTLIGKQMRQAKPVKDPPVNAPMQERTEQNARKPKKWSRRAFGRRVVAAAAGLATAGLATAGTAPAALALTGARGQTPESRRKRGHSAGGRSPGRYFDIHTHITQKWGNRPAFSVEDLLRTMDEYDIAWAAVLPLVSPLAWDHPVTTDYVLEQTKPHRDRLVPFCAIDPRSTEWGRPMVEKLKQYVDAGARGFGEHKVGIAIDDPRNLELFAACGEVGLPVLFHLDSLRNTDAPGLPGLEKVLREVPQTNFIGHAQGWWASISGNAAEEDLQGYPEREVAPSGAIDRLMDAYPNLYGDLSAGSGANAIQRDPAFGREFLIRRADRLLFGTDFLKTGQQVPQIELYRTLDLPDDVQNKIFRENARTLILE